MNELKRRYLFDECGETIFQQRPRFESNILTLRVRRFSNIGILRYQSVYMPDFFWWGKFDKFDEISPSFSNQFVTSSTWLISCKFCN